MKSLYIIVTITLTLITHALAESFRLSSSNDVFSLAAENTELSKILAEIDRQVPATLKFYGNFDELISAAFTNLALDQLLFRLGVSYVLMYEQDDEGRLQLSDAVALDSDAQYVDAETTAYIQKLVRDLRDDDIRNNATSAINKLYDLGCAAVPYLQNALYDEDMQARLIAAQLLRRICPVVQVSDRMIDLAFETLDLEDLDYNQHWLISGWTAFSYLERADVYPRSRGRILMGLQDSNPRTRLYSALLAAEQREEEYAYQIAHILIPHLADNDISYDGAAAANALYKLGEAILPQLQPYRDSKDQQQAELAELICASIEQGSIAPFNPVMYANPNMTPLEQRSFVSYIGLREEKLPDEAGLYFNLTQPRRTAADIYNYRYPWNTYSEELEREAGTVSSPQTTEHTGTDGPDHVIKDFPYTVKAGDTLDSIARKFSVSIPELISRNPSLTADGLIVSAGSKLLIPWD